MYVFSLVLGLSRSQQRPELITFWQSLSPLFTWVLLTTRKRLSQKHGPHCVLVLAFQASAVSLLTFAGLIWPHPPSSLSHSTILLVLAHTGLSQSLEGLHKMKNICKMVK